LRKKASLKLECNMESIESSNSNRKKNTVDVYDAIVIGGGCAGVEATRKLYANGVKNILLLEAQDRLGGRIRTIYLHGNKNMPIEYGANWIHGIADNVLYNVVKENETRFYHEKEDLFCDDNVYCADEDGNKYSSELCDEMYDLYRKFNQDSKLFLGAEHQLPVQELRRVHMVPLRGVHETRRRGCQEAKTSNGQAHSQVRNHRVQLLVNETMHH